MRVGLFIISLCLYLMSSAQPTLSMPSEVDEIQSARRVLCLGLQDKEKGKTWSQTSSLHTLFWQNIKDKSQIKSLSDQGFSLAQSYHALSDFDIPEPNIPKILQTITDILRNILYVCLPTPQDQYIHELIAEDQLRDSYDSLLKTGNMQFILFWQFNTTFLKGLSIQTQRDLYFAAQATYKKEFGNVYVYSNHFPKPPLSPLNRDIIGGRFTSQSIDLPYMLDIEAKWGALVDLGDPLVAYELAKTWKCSQIEDADVKARLWYNRYQALAPSLPFGDYSSLSKNN